MDNKGNKGSMWRAALLRGLPILPVGILPPVLTSAILLALRNVSAVRALLGGDAVSLILTICGITATVGVAIAIVAIYFVFRASNTYYRLISLTLRDIVNKNRFNPDTLPDGISDTDVSDALREISDKLQRLGNDNRRLMARNTRLSTDKDKLEFNLMTNKASPILFRDMSDAIERQAKSSDCDGIIELTGYAKSLADRVIRDSSQTVLLSQELEMVSEYLRMNDMMSGRRTGYRLSVMCNIVKYRMIPHVILPVVDNFVRLASRENTPKYEINIEVTMSYENLLITIRDNGYGMDAYQLERMRREIEEDVIDYNDAYISVANVNRRIKWRYGERYGLDISSSRLGSVIRISLPTSGEE